MNDEQATEILNSLGGLSLAYLNLVLCLHDNGVIDKDELAARLKKTIARTPDLPKEAEVLLRKLAVGLETSEKSSH